MYSNVIFYMNVLKKRYLAAPKQSKNYNMSIDNYKKEIYEHVRETEFLGARINEPPL